MTETVEAILQEQIEYSSYSAEESFTLSDILVEKDQIEDKGLLEAQMLDLDFDDCFDDEGMFQDDGQEEEENKQQGIQATPSKETQVVMDTLKPENQQSARKSIYRNSSAGKDLYQQVSSNRASSYQPIIDRCKRIQNLQLPPISEVKNIDFIVLKNVTAAFDSTSKGVGISTVITSNSIKYLAVGTSFGNIVLFEVGNKGKTVLGTAQNRKYGMISAMAISREGRYLVSGQQNGLITLWDLSTMQQLKKEMASETKIIKMIFCQQSQFILADADGNVFLFTIQNYFWFKLKRQRLFQKTRNIYYDIKIHSLQSGMEAIVLCSLQQVLVASYKPKVQAIDRLVRPQELNQSKIPNIEIGKTAILSIQNPSNRRFQYNDVICISWSNHILVYKFMDGVRVEKLELVYRFTQQNPVYNMQFISQGVLVTLDNRQTFRSFRLWINDGGGHELLNQKTIPQQVIYQRYVRDSNKRYIKLFNNTIISCAFSPKQKQLFFIGRNSIFRCRVYKWNDYITQIINQEHNYELSLRICMQIYNKKMNIFLQPIIINDKTMKILYEVGKIYLKKRFQLIQKLLFQRSKNAHKDQLALVYNQIQQTFQSIVEYMLQIKSAGNLFQIVFQSIVKKSIAQDQYNQIFLECLIPFIMRGKLNSLPNKQIFIYIINYYIPLNNRQLVDNLIMFLDIQTLSKFYQDAIDICSQNKLYKSLAYVCATHEDYVPPLTSLLNQVRLAQINGKEKAQDTYYLMLKDYIQKLLKSQYINGTLFEDTTSNMKKSLSNWLMCKQTFTFFAKNEVEEYRHDYFHFVEDLVILLSRQHKWQDYIHSELKYIRNQKNYQKEIAQLFIKLSSIISLEPEQVILIVQNSNKEQIERFLPKYLNFYRDYYKQLSKMQNIEQFYIKNKQLHYFHHLIKANQAQKPENLLAKVDLQTQSYSLNGQLTKFILTKMHNKQILWNLEQLLKIHSQNTMIFMLQRFSIDTVNQKLASIKDSTYRYIIIRKLLKKLRKQNNALNKRQKIKKYRKKKLKLISSPVSSSPGSFISSNEPKSYLSSQSDTDSVMSISQTDRLGLDNRKLGKQIMQFYIECLCKYKNEKRVYYQFICNMNDYSDSIQELIDIINQYNFHSCLGLLEQTRKNYQKAFIHFSKVYQHFFFQQNYKKLVRYTHCHGRFVRRMFQRMLSLTFIINTQPQWMQLLKCVINPLEQKSIKHQERGKQNNLVCDDIQEVFIKQPEKYVFIKQLGYILEQCLVNVGSEISIQTISSYIGQHQHVFSRMFVLQSFRTTLLTFSKNSSIYHITNHMIIQNQVKAFEDIHQNLVEGFAPNIVCQKCNQGFDEEYPLLSYRCGHSYHATCPLAGYKMARNTQYRSSIMRQSRKQSSKLEEQDQKCPKCEHQYAKSRIQEEREILPDFHKQYEQNLLVKGMVGIVTIIPNMISAIPDTLNSFGSKNQTLQQKIVAPLLEQQASTQLEEEVRGFRAFNEHLFGLEQQTEKFIEECGQYFDDYQQ